MRKGRRVFRFLVIALFVIALGGAASALTASNTVPGTTAGSGSGTISGYTVSAVTYTLNGTTPTNIDAVGFTLSAAATTVKAKLVAANTAYYSCTNTSGNVWSCATTSAQATVAGSDQLAVIAIQ